MIAVALISWFVIDKRYRGVRGGNLQATNEVFVDPATGKLVRVYEDTKTGQREYREEPPP